MKPTKKSYDIDSCSRPNEIMKSPALRKSKYYIILILAVSDITTSVLHLPIDGSFERKQIAAFIFGF